MRNIQTIDKPNIYVMFKKNEKTSIYKGWKERSE